MNNLQIKNVMAFVPAKDFQLSSRFYEEIGFIKAIATDKSAQFVMQNYGLLAAGLLCKYMGGKHHVTSVCGRRS
jgi:predicted lactoylglutathione lyase